MLPVELRGLLLDYAGVLDDPGRAGALPLLEVAHHARRSGISTAVVSNASGLPDPRIADLFDAVVLSGAVAVAKPSREIYLLTAHRLGLEPRQCVFVDDLQQNVAGAVHAGMVGVHHRGVDSTIAELTVLFDLQLPPDLVVRG
ncbi:haloacid dehalogenase superfamily, subfamily IA, variant 3 with third motif having DD or ED [Saccharopolyspora kobensis]|uniref:Haloacid dehalogenase superfamily, subfamily IA, variant 3 with third motif having DD or ED n=1 Tax=Saccharopolyspora kobensis TaxID=146035 RepID=A0A1H6EL97_9PSEU|nr:haloacid dehalogenase superfamily, subfamily IA, variant 3 with third motif having DD or ED [Saccharopolyspora kobensis]SFF27619.1 haloacid dehalogenase superfamily, subfamily IA, variant 3 with third motif having DD or ED [Saccharopolyspora kobensis]